MRVRSGRGQPSHENAEGAKPGVGGMGAFLLKK